MNPQAFRRKLELAVEERDQTALKELEQVAGQSACTHQIWQDHLLIEQAIEQWKRLPVSAVTPSVTPSRTTASLPTTVTSVASVSNSGCNSGRRPRFLLRQTALLASCLLLVGGIWAGLYSGFSADGVPFLSGWDQARTVAETGAEPADPALRPVFAGLLEGRVPSPKSTASSGALLGCSMAYADQGRGLLPVGILSAFPEMTTDFEQRVLVTLDTLAALPVEMQEVWLKFSSPGSYSEDSPLPGSVPPEGDRVLEQQTFQPLPGLQLSHVADSLLT